MFLDKKEIEDLKNILADKDREIERLRKENNELRSQMEGDHPVSPYCAVCIHGINEWEYRLCDLECKCKDFKRPMQTMCY